MTYTVRTRRKIALSPHQLAERNARIIACRQGGMLSPEIGEREGLTTAYVIKLLSKLRVEGADIPRQYHRQGGSPKVHQPMARATGIVGICRTTVYSQDMEDAEAMLVGLMR